GVVAFRTACIFPGGAPRRAAGRDGRGNSRMSWKDKTNMVKIEPFDTARHLDNPEVVAHYLAEAFQTRDSKLILRAVSNVVRAGRIKKVAKIARETGLSRTSLYWKEKASPEFTTVLRILDSVGVQLEPVAKPPKRRHEPTAVARAVMKRRRNALRELAKK